MEGGSIVALPEDDVTSIPSLSKKAPAILVRMKLSMEP